MSGTSRWRDSGHLQRAVETAGGQAFFDAAVNAMLDDACNGRLAEMPQHGVTSGQAAVAVDGSATRIDQAECGGVSPEDVVRDFTYKSVKIV